MLFGMIVRNLVQNILHRFLVVTLVHPRSPRPLLNIGPVPESLAAGILARSRSLPLARPERHHLAATGNPPLMLPLNSTPPSSPKRVPPNIPFPPLHSKLTSGIFEKVSSGIIS